MITRLLTGFYYQIKEDTLLKFFFIHKLVVLKTFKMASDLHNFHVADYIVFGGMLLISITIGIYHACAGGKQKSTKEFFMANQSMRSLPVALSVLASFFSASTLLGTPAEIYQYGTQYWISVFGAMCAPITGALLFGPLFFKLKVVSVFQVCLSNL